MQIQMLKLKLGISFFFGLRRDFSGFVNSPNTEIYFLSDDKKPILNLDKSLLDFNVDGNEIDNQCRPKA